MFRKEFLGLLIICFFFTTQSAVSELRIPENPKWRPMKDEVYLQEVGRKIETDQPLFAVAVLDDVACVANAKGVWKLEENQLIRAGGPEEKISRMKALDGSLWAIGESGVWKGSASQWRKIADGSYTDICLHLGDVVVSSQSDLHRVEGDRLVQINSEPSRQPILGVASYAETLYVRHEQSVGLIQEGLFLYEDVSDWGHLPQGVPTRDILSLGSRLLVATEKGIGELRGMTWRRIRGEDGLCYEDTTSLAAGFDRDYWVGTTRGAIRATGDEFHYFNYQRWLPHERVNAIACGDRVVYIATDGGLGIIEYEPYTLQKKAAWYERWLEEWGQKRLGFIHVLIWDAGNQEWVRFLSDNDVGYSAHYIDAQCFRYAVTGDEEARAAAVDSFLAMKWSEEITPIDGFPARAVHAIGERAILSDTGSGGLPAEWHETSDGVWQWKGDTSSDETDAHVYATYIFHELVAQGEEKDLAKDHLRRMIGHIVDNGWVLRDLDGKPTRWARWDPEYLQRPYGYYARGLNGMEALNYATTAYALTGIPKFKEGKQQLLDWGYHNESLRQKLVFPNFTPWDDRLAFYAYYPLLNCEKDPHLRSIFMRSLERSWEIKRLERVPWFNFIYGAVTGNDCETKQAVGHLREWPLDLVSYSYMNSHRDDLYRLEDYKNYVGETRALSIRELGPHRWDTTFLHLDGGGAGRSVSDPSGWLDAYWMGRYYGFIEAPTVEDENLLTVEERDLNSGADPYDGPARAVPER